MRDVILKAITEVSGESKAMYFKPVNQVKEASVKTAIKKYAPYCALSDVVAIMDITMFESGKDGFLLTTHLMYGKGWKQPVRLAELEKVIMGGRRETYITLTYSDGKTQEVYGSIYAPYLCKVLSAIIEKMHKTTSETKVPKEAHPEIKEKSAADLYEEGAAFVKEDNYEAAVPFFLKAAELGFVEAQYFLAVCYIKGWGTKLDEDASMKWAEKAAEQGHEKAQELMDIFCQLWFERGMTACESQEFTSALNWLKKIDEHGDETVREAIVEVKAYCLYRNAVQRYKTGNHKDAFREFQQASEYGNAEAQYNLGVMYDLGQGTSVNKREALHWFLKAAEQGLVEAQMTCGQKYAEGDGTPEDQTAAFNWYLKAAKQGNPIAQVQVSFRYTNSMLGTKRDIEEAKKWLHAAAEQGNEDAIGILNELNK